MELAAAGATEVSMWDLNCGMEEEQRKRTQAALEARREELNASAGTRVKAEAAEELKKRNQAALAALRKKREESLPEGWKMVRSQPFLCLDATSESSWFSRLRGARIACHLTWCRALAACVPQRGRVLGAGGVQQQERPGGVRKHSHRGAASVVSFRARAPAGCR